MCLTTNMEEFDKEKEQCLEILKVTGEDAKRVNDVVTSVLEKIKKGKLKFENGHKLVGLKNHMFVSYIINLVQIMLKKVKGESIASSDEVWRTIEIRAVMEKMQRLERKLKYEIEKKVSAAMTGLSKNDPLRFKPDPSNLISQVDEDDDDDTKDDEEGEEDDDDDEGKEKKSDVYRPPKLVPKHYEEDESMNIRKEKVLNRAKQRALSSSMMADLRKEFTDQPDEVFHGHGTNRASEIHKILEKKEYEEKYFVRKQMTKQEKTAKKRARSLTSSILEVGRFSDVAALAGEEAEQLFKRAGKKRKARSAGRGRKKKVRFN